MYLIKSLHFLFLSTCVSVAAMINIEVDDFISPTIEHFNDSWVTASYYDFDNGMNYSNLSGTGDYINFDRGYSLANAGTVDFGRDHDNFFCTNFAPTSFAFTFSEAIYQFGFYGAESVTDDGEMSRNGILDIELYGVGNTLLGAITQDTKGIFAWDQFHGYQSDEAVTRVVFRNVGHMVLDDIHFSHSSPNQVPEPGVLGMVIIGGSLLIVFRRNGRKH